MQMHDNSIAGAYLFSVNVLVYGIVIFALIKELWPIACPDWTLSSTF